MLAASGTRKPSAGSSPEVVLAPITRLQSRIRPEHVSTDLATFEGDPLRQQPVQLSPRCALGKKSMMSRRKGHIHSLAQCLR